jgi:hypothetical protein
MANTENLKPWQPGQSGNPSGRPKTKPITKALQDLFEDPEFAKAFAQAAVDHANKGSGTHFKEIAERLEGKVPQAIVGEDGSPLQVQWTGMPSRGECPP